MKIFKAEWLVIGFLSVMLLLLVYFMYMAERTWAEFSEANNCKVVGKIKGDSQTGIGYGVTSSGQFGTITTTTTAPSKTGYLCDDGVTYWR